MGRSQSRVTSTLTVSASDTNGWAGAGHNLKTLVERSFVDLEALYTSAHLDRLAGVVLIRPVLEFDIFQVMRPKTKSTGTSALTIEIMTSVAYESVSIHTQATNTANIRMIRRMLLSLANLIPAVISEGPSTLIE